MSSIIITLQSSHQRAAMDLELPGDVPLQDLLPALLQALQLSPTDAKGWPIPYQLVHQKQQRPLRPTETLLNAGVVTGDVLFLKGGAVPGPGDVGLRSMTRLRSPSGMVVVLDNYGKTELTIGRYDARTGKSPDIDLSGEPHGNTVSRSHALLRRQGNQWILVALSPRSTTLVGNTQIAPQQSHPLKPGDVITLGAVRLVFEVG